MTKRGRSFVYESSHSRGRVSLGLFVRRSVDIFEGCSEDYLYLFLFSILDTFILVHGSYDRF